jgi:hypothetical protein
MQNVIGKDFILESCVPVSLLLLSVLHCGGA